MRNFSKYEKTLDGKEKSDCADKNQIKIRNKMSEGQQNEGSSSKVGNLD